MPRTPLELEGEKHMRQMTKVRGPHAVTLVRRMKPDHGHRLTVVVSEQIRSEQRITGVSS